MSSVLTVTQLNRYVSYKIKSDLKLKGIAVKGEISNFTVHYKSGHAYFTVKDAESAVKAVMFSGSVQKLKFQPENGMSVLVMGNLEVYERDGVYQIIASEITPLGTGLLHTQIELVKEKLRKRGVFDESLKKRIPVFPKKIAVVTSLTGAALQDILHITERRYPLCEVQVFPAQVQGTEAAKSVCAALKSADRSGADTLILARGGGSLEDLMPFNTEQVAVAVAECTTPIITAVGHETDTTLCDYAADLRAPTPSAAAELATPDKQDMINAVILMRSKLDKCISDFIAGKSAELENTAIKLKARSPEKKLAADVQRFNSLKDKLDMLMNRRLELLSLDVEKYVGQLNMLSPFNVLNRGYSLVEKDGILSANAEGLSAGDKVKIRFSDGEADAEITDVRFFRRNDKQ